jgi:Gamma-glutamyl cyclotransferase, AIG2-like
MRFFFYGTLMDPALLAWVLGRRVAARALLPARLHGYRRCSVEGFSYPLVLRRRGQSVEGVVVERASRAELRRLIEYEGEDYRLSRATAAIGDGRLLPVFLFTPRPGRLKPTGRPWRPAARRRGYFPGVGFVFGRGLKSAGMLFATPSA